MPLLLHQSIRFVAVAALLVLFAVPGRTSAQSRSPETTTTVLIESKHEEPSTARRPIGLLIAGPLVFAVPWLVNGVVSLFAGLQWGSTDWGWEDVRRLGFVPLVGPWIQLALEPDTAGPGWATWFIVSGIAQAAGVAMLIAGVVLRTEPDDAPYVMVLPDVGPDGAGLRVAGRF